MSSAMTTTKFGRPPGSEGGVGAAALPHPRNEPRDPSTAARAAMVVRPLGTEPVSSFSRDFAARLRSLGPARPVTVPMLAHALELLALLRGQEGLDLGHSRL